MEQGKYFEVCSAFLVGLAGGLWSRHSCVLMQNTIACLFSFTLGWNLLIPSDSSMSIT